MNFFDIIFFATGEYMEVSRQFIVMTALLKDLFLWFITQVLVLVCSEVGQGKLGQICLECFNTRMFTNRQHKHTLHHVWFLSPHAVPKGRCIHALC